MRRIVLAIACASFGLLLPLAAGAESLLSTTYTAGWTSPGFLRTRPSAFVLGPVRNETGRETSFEVAAHLREELRGQLLKEGFLESFHPGDTDAARIEVSIRLFQEGGAFGRWLGGGAGAAYAVGYAKVSRAERDPGAELIAVSVISHGGVFSVGAEKTVLNDIAGKIVELLRSGNSK